MGNNLYVDILWATTWMSTFYGRQLGCRHFMGDNLDVDILWATIWMSTEERSSNSVRCLFNLVKIAHNANHLPNGDKSGHLEKGRPWPSFVNLSPAT
jgi:hypothetical protein